MTPMSPMPFGAVLVGPFVAIESAHRDPPAMSVVGRFETSPKPLGVDLTVDGVAASLRIGRRTLEVWLLADLARAPDDRRFQFRVRRERKGIWTSESGSARCLVPRGFLVDLLPHTQPDGHVADDREMATAEGK
jgi:hypothetical protein